MSEMMTEERLRKLAGADAVALAELLKNLLTPYCERVSWTIPGPTIFECDVKDQEQLYELRSIICWFSGTQFREGNPIRFMINKVEIMIHFHLMTKPRNKYII